MLDLSMINPYIRVAMHSIISAHSEIKRRIIFDYELIYIADGEFTFTYDDIAYLCKSGQFILIRPGISHSFHGIDYDLAQPHIHFDITHIGNSRQVPVSFKDWDALTGKEKGWIREDVFHQYPKTPLVFFADKQQALALFYQIIDTPDASVITRKAKLMELLELLINDNFANAFRSENPTYPVEKQVKDYIDAGQGLCMTLDDFSKHFNYSKCHLEHCFGARYGAGIMAYRNQKRMETAKQLLQQNSVTAVSEKLGFSSIYVFSRAYKNYFGVSPKTTKSTQ